MSALSESGCGVQVVFVEEDGTYRVDEEALRRVTSHEAARDLPVAVVSVAGATRGGKSFLLDFFLRYLRATDRERCDGSWIGAEDQPLTGFSWRGGWERNTTGIMLWSLPIVVTQEVDGKSQKLAVLLMDTQGTFDNNSTVKDCTTIFAMSTLISSVQIYNLAQLIKEDDLQHLQLFTEYGKLAQGDGGTKPFQSLVFRVRDWMCPYEHPYGAAGGDRYLTTVLKAETKKQEIRELRDSIRSSFETVSCVLTPSPGRAVTDQNFNGRLCDLDSEFKESLLELVPFILHPAKLFPKSIHGNKILTGELPTYFRTYVDIFNSDDLPNPVGILQATGMANLETALVATRAAYCSEMERGGDTRRVPRGVVARLHAAALDAARETFAARKTLAAPALANTRLEALMRELDAMMTHYVEINNAKLLKAVADTRETYEAAIRRVIGDRPVCLHPLDLKELHTDAKDAAMAVFDNSRLPSEDEDPDRLEILQGLETKYQELNTHNMVNNRAARAQAVAVYTEHVKRASAAGAVSDQRLNTEHDRARNAALAAFADARCRHYGCEDYDPYLQELFASISEQHAEWVTVNSNNSRTARRTALFAYNNHMGGVWGPHRCLHPAALRREHDVARAAARAEIGDAGDITDFEAMLETRYNELKAMNESANEALVDASYSEYCRRMDAKSAPSVASILIVPLALKILQLPRYHQEAARAAREYFHSHRRSFGDEDDDDYLESLNQKLSAGYDVYCPVLPAVARELNLPV